MNRNFEQEYKELAKMEVPDLWDRIEAGLTEKSTPSSSPQKPVVVPFVKRYSALAAAILCAILIIPVAGVMKQVSGGSSKSSDTAMMEETTEEAADFEASMAEEAEAGGEEMFAAAAAAAEEENTFEEAPAEAAEESFQRSDSMQDATADMENATMEKQLSESKTEAEKEAEDMAKTLGLSEAQVLTGVTVEVTAAEDDIIGKTLEETGTLYTAVVHEDPSGILKEGEEIVIFIPIYSSYGLIKDEIVELDLEYSGAEKDYFTLP